MTFFKKNYCSILLLYSPYRAAADDSFRLHFVHFRSDYECIHRPWQQEEMMKKVNPFFGRKRNKVITVKVKEMNIDEGKRF